jgi:hypothetical protein
MAIGKQSESKSERDWRQDIPFKVTVPVTYFLQVGPIS